MTAPPPPLPELPDDDAHNIKVTRVASLRVAALLPTSTASSEEDLEEQSGGKEGNVSPRIARAAYGEAEEANERMMEEKREAEKEARNLLDGKLHSRKFSDWALEADDALSLEELQMEADEVSEMIEGKWGGLKRAEGERGCRSAGAVRKRVEDAVSELAQLQMITAGIAANAERGLGKGGLGRGEVCRLRITLDYLVRLMLQQAFEIRDEADRHR